MTAKPDRRILYYALAVAFILCAVVTAAAVVLLPYRFAALIGIIGAGLFVLLCAYLILSCHFISYYFCERYIRITSGIIIRRTVYLYLDRKTAEYRFSLPFDCAFTVIKVIGGGAVILLDIEKLKQETNNPAV